MGDATDSAQGKLSLYTNHACPWAHRAHIALKELGLSYDETIIDLEKPRDEWYLKINDVRRSHKLTTAGGIVYVLIPVLLARPSADDPA